MFLMIDNYDSFVFNLLRYFKELNEDIKIKRNDKITIEEIMVIKNNCQIGQKILRRRKNKLLLLVKANQHKFQVI